MSSNYFRPAETSGIPTIEGALSADRASGPETYDRVLPVQPQAAPQPPPDVAGLSRVQSQAMAQDAQQAPPFRELTMKADGTFAMKGDQSMLAEVMGQLTDLKTMKAAAMARVAQLQQQESSGSPILDALSQFAGGMAANDPKMPGWVRALGATSLQMGPQGIRQRREAEEQKVAALSKGIAGTALDAAKLEDDRENLTMSMIAKAKQDAEKQEKDLTSAALRIRTAQIGEIKSSGEFDADGAAEEMRAHGIPEEVVQAQIDSLARYKADYAKKQGEIAAAKDAKERRQRREELDDMDRRFHERDKALATTLGAAFGWKKTQASMPKQADTNTVQAAGSVLSFLGDAEKFIGDSKASYKGGPVAGIIARNNPWRNPDVLKAQFASYQLTLQSLKASGLAPISEIEFENQRKQVVNPDLTFGQAKALVARMREVTERGLRQYILMKPEVNWDLVKPALPKSLHEILPEMRKRREEIYGSAAPDIGRLGGSGASPQVPGLPPGWTLVPVE